MWENNILENYTLRNSKNKKKTTQTKAHNKQQQQQQKQKQKQTQQKTKTHNKKQIDTLIHPPGATTGQETIRDCMGK